jgi:hypothetical protein
MYRSAFLVLMRRIFAALRTLLRALPSTSKQSPTFMLCHGYTLVSFVAGIGIPLRICMGASLLR